MNNLHETDMDEINVYSLSLNIAFDIKDSEVSHFFSQLKNIKKFCIKLMRLNALSKQGLATKRQKGVLIRSEIRHLKTCQ